MVGDFIFDSTNNVLAYYKGDAEDVTLPENYNGGTYTIGQYAFEGKRTHNLTIPNKVTGIGENAFYDCPNLTSVKIGLGVLSMGRDAFANCPNLYKVFLMGNTKPTGIESAFAQLNGRMTYVSNDIYNDIDALGTVNKYSLLNSMFEVGGVIYIPTSMSARTCDAVDCSYDSEDTEVAVDNTVLYRGVVFNVANANSHLFRNNPYIENATVNFPAEVPANAFSGCSGMEMLTIGKNISGIGQTPFEGDVALKTLIIGDSSEPLPISNTRIFKDTQIAELYLGRTLAYTTTSDGPFNGMNTLRSLKIGNHTTAIGNYMFCGTALEGTLRFPASVASIGYNAFGPSAGAGKPMNVSEIIFDNSDNPVNVACSFATTNVKKAVIGRNFGENQAPFGDCTTLKSVSMSERVTAINPGAFRNCSSLQMANIPSRVARVPEQAFAGCTSLESIDFPPAVTAIGDNAFNGAGLGSVNIGSTVSTVGESAFEGCGNLQYASVAAAAVGRNAFLGSGLLHLELTTDVNSLGDAAFKNCSNLRAAEIGAATIGAEAFAGCSSLVSAKLADRTQSIGEGAFNGCSSLAVVNIPEGNTTIAPNVFAGTSALAEIILPQTLTAIGFNAFSRSGLRSLVIPAAVATIGATALANTSQLALLTFEAATEPITVSNSAFTGMGVVTANINRQLNYDTTDYSPFYGNRTLTTVTMDDTPTTLLTGMFSGCQRLQSVRMSDNVTEIGAKAFDGCSALTTINIPEGVTQINDFTFRGCSSLKSIELPGVRTLGRNSFASSGLQTFVALPPLEQIGLGTFLNCVGLEEFVALSGSNGLEISNAGSGKGMFADCPLKKVSIDRPLSYGIQASNGYSPFYRITTLTTVELGDYVPMVPANMFYGCSALTDVVIGDGVTSFGEYAFSGCQSIQRFYFGGNVESIGEEAFSDCAAMVELWSQAVVPPTCGSQALADINKWDCELFVPMGTADAYGTADQWQDFLFMGETTGKTVMATGISLSKLSLNMKIDDTAEIMATILPTSVQDNFPVTWTSSNEDVAVVVDGTVTAVGQGSCQIIATTTANGVLMSACNVTVDKLDQEIQWTQELGGLYIGDEVTFDATADSGLDVAYTVTAGDNVGVLTGNTLHINDIGTMEITAVQPGNNRYNASNAVVRSITIIPVNPKTITMDNDVTVHVGQNLALAAQIEPFNAYDKSITWKSVDENIVTVDADGSITGVYNGETYVVATSANGLRANCRVTVNSLGDNFLAIDDAEIDCGVTWNMPVALTNIVDIASAEFDIELPTALTFVTGDDGYLVPTLTDRAAGYTVMANILSERSAHIEVFSWGNKTFAGAGGESLLTIPVLAGEAKANAIVKVSNIKLRSAEGETIMPGADNATVTIKMNGLPGDVNDNGVVNIADAVMIVNHTIGKTPANFNEDMADVDGNGRVTIADVVLVVNYINGKISEFPGLTTRNAAERSNDCMKVEARTEADICNVEIALDNLTPYAGIQMTIEIPYGYEYIPGSLVAGQRMANFYLAENDEGPSTLRVAAFSTSGLPVEGNSGTVLSLVLQRTAGADEGVLTVTDIETADTYGRAHSMDDACCTIGVGISSIDDAVCDGADTVRIDGMDIHFYLSHAQRVAISDMGGHTTYHDLEAGHSVVTVPTAGYYIVITDNNTLKLLIK